MFLLSTVLVSYSVVSFSHWCCVMVLLCVVHIHTCSVGIGLIVVVEADIGAQCGPVCASVCASSWNASCDSTI